MKTALDNYEIGKLKEISADDFSYVVRDKDRFICPSCFENVTMVDGPKTKYFKHGRKTPETVECERRVDGDANKSISERVGMPLFLRKTDKGFRLTIGFRPLTPSIIRSCKDTTGYVTIVDINKQEEQKYYINEENFSVFNVAYKNVKFISRDNLIIKYSSEQVAKLVQPYWSNYIETSITRRGALFHDGITGGKIIRPGDCITTYKSYLWVIPEYRTFEIHGFIEMDFSLIGKITIDNRDFCIYQGMFKTDSSNPFSFSKVANYLRSTLKLFLLDADSSITALWPPCIKSEIGYKTPESQNMYYLINTNSDTPIPYVYYETMPVPDIYDPKQVGDSFFIKLPPYRYGRTININRRIVSNGSYIRPAIINQKESRSYLEENMEVQFIEFDHLEQLKLNVSSKVDAYLIDKQNDIQKVTFNSGKVSFKKNNKVVYVYLFCNEKLIAIFKKKVIETVEEDNDFSYLKDLSFSSHESVEVIINAQLMRRINDLINYDSGLEKVFRPYLKQNKIPLSLVNSIRRYMK